MGMALFTMGEDGESIGALPLPPPSFRWQQRGVTRLGVVTDWSQRAAAAYRRGRVGWFKPLGKRPWGARGAVTGSRSRHARCSSRRRRLADPSPGGATGAGSEG